MSLHTEFWGSSRLKQACNNSCCHCVRLAPDRIYLSDLLRISKILTVVIPQLEVMRVCQCTSILVWHTSVPPAKHNFTYRLYDVKNDRWQPTKSSFFATQLPISVAYRCAWTAVPLHKLALQPAKTLSKSKCCGGQEHLLTLSPLPGLRAMQAHDAAHGQLKDL